MTTLPNYIVHFSSVEWWRNLSEQQSASLASKYCNTLWVNLDAGQIAHIHSQELSK